MFIIFIGKIMEVHVDDMFLKAYKWQTIYRI